MAYLTLWLWLITNRFPLTNLPLLFLEWATISSCYNILSYYGRLHFPKMAIPIIYPILHALSTMWLSHFCPKGGIYDPSSQIWLGWVFVSANGKQHWRTIGEHWTMENSMEKPQQQKWCYVTSHAKLLKGCNFCLPVSLKKLPTVLRGSSGHKKGPSRKNWDSQPASQMSEPPWEWFLQPSQAYRWLQS